MVLVCWSDTGVSVSRAQVLASALAALYGSESLGLVCLGLSSVPTPPESCSYPFLGILPYSALRCPGGVLPCPGGLSPCSGAALVVWYWSLRNLYIFRSLQHVLTGSAAFGFSADFPNSCIFCSFFTGICLLWCCGVLLDTPVWAERYFTLNTGFLSFFEKCRN